VQFFSRKASLVFAFRLPLSGQRADQVPPKWLVSRLQSGELEVNRLGGITIITPWGVQACAPGDVVILNEDGSISFERPEAFERDFEPVTSEQLHAA
jgi:hypothetical protein